MIYSAIGRAGNDGEKDRSDCLITVELAPSGGVQISLVSKVQALFGESIHALCRQVADFFEMQHARIIIADKGALPFVLAARLEAAIKKVLPTDKEFLLDMLPENSYSSTWDSHRFSRLYLPGNTPSLMINAGLHKPNAVILDLEDAVAHDKKNEAVFWFEMPCAVWISKALNAWYASINYRVGWTIWTLLFHIRSCRVSTQMRERPPVAAGQR
jgi:citrate lyase subunit beta/citryl-CoA lyase